MAVKTEFSTEDFRALLADYALGEFLGAAPILRGGAQTNYFVTTTAGQFVFRRYENRSPESVQFEVDLLAFLAAPDFPGPVPVADRQGRVIVPAKDKPSVLFHYIEGEHVTELNRAQKEQVIQTAARLQVLTTNYDPPMKAHRWNYTPALVMRLATAETQRLGTESARGKLAWLEAEIAKLSLPAALPKGICHFDFDASNLLFDGDTLVGLLDFDDANYSYLNLDPSGLVDFWACPHPAEKPDLDVARDIVDTYQAVRTFSSLEKSHFFDAHKLGILLDCIWFYGRGDADDFYERRKIDNLNALGREAYTAALFAV